MPDDAENIQLHVFDLYAYEDNLSEGLDALFAFMEMKFNLFPTIRGVKTFLVYKMIPGKYIPTAEYKLLSVRETIQARVAVNEFDDLVRMGLGWVEKFKEFHKNKCIFEAEYLELFRSNEEVRFHNVCREYLEKLYVQRKKSSDGEQRILPSVYTKRIVDQ